VRLSCIQFAVATVLAAVMTVICRETWESPAVMASMPYWMFCGIGSSAVAFTLQMVAQKYLHPVTATLLMSLESVFAVLGGWLLLNEWLTGRELCGCLVIFIAVIISQLPLPAKKSVES
jgi:drug/metabolite transporter (DMT)-like permease